MDVQTAAKTIQLILAPVVMVSACGILLTGMLGHFGNINDRIRRLTGERLELSQLQPAEGHEALARERLTEIDHQIPMLIGRHLQVRHAILLANTAVAILVVSMFVIAAAALGHSSATGTVALFVFLAGTAAVMGSAVFMALEVRSSHRSVSYEGMRVIDLPCAWTGSPIARPLDAGRPDRFESMALGPATDQDWRKA
jgi:Protein of unknown function (DUF2721)